MVRQNDGGVYKAERCDAAEYGGSHLVCRGKQADSDIELGVDQWQCLFPDADDFPACLPELHALLRVPLVILRTVVPPEAVELYYQPQPQIRADDDDVYSQRLPVRARDCRAIDIDWQDSREFSL